MTDAGRGVDSLGIFLTGGAANTDPAASLGGVISTKLVHGMSAIFAPPVPALDIGQIYPASGEGDATLVIDGTGDGVLYTPPGGEAGTKVTILAGETKVVAGFAESAALSMTREAGLEMGGPGTLKLVFPMNGVLSMSNVASADRIAGITTYRAMVLSALGVFGVINIRLWMPPVVGAQAVFSLATEPVIAGAVQSIASETIAPTGLSFVTPTTEVAALTIVSIASGTSVGLWIRRVFPAAGLVAAQEEFHLAMKYKGA